MDIRLIPYLLMIVLGFGLTVVIETSVAWFLKYRRKEEIQIVILSTVVTYPILHLLLSIYLMMTGYIPGIVVILFLEVFVVIVEFYILQYVFSTKYTKKQMFLLAFIMNAASYLIGLLIF